MRYLPALLALTCCTQVQAEPDPLIHWWDVSLSALHGENYELTPSDKQTTLTFETAGGWRYGDWFAFQDVTYFNGSDVSKSNTTYGEITTRFSAGKIFDLDLTYGIVKDLSLALQLEEGEGPIETLLYGVGVDLAIPYFSNFKINTYKKDALRGDNNPTEWQVSPSFMVNIPVGNSDIIIDGYIDWIFNTTDEIDSFHFNPQVKYDLGKALHQKASTFLIGIEYDLWLNKYGVEGIDQNTFSMLMKYHF